jgi:hypothetical protein
MSGPVFRKVNKAGRVELRRLSEDAVRQANSRMAGFKLWAVSAVMHLLDDGWRAL